MLKVRALQNRSVIIKWVQAMSSVFRSTIVPSCFVSAEPITARSPVYFLENFLVAFAKAMLLVH